jgi:hypothetical protein
MVFLRQTNVMDVADVLSPNPTLDDDEDNGLPPPLNFQTPARAPTDAVVTNIYVASTVSSVAEDVDDKTKTALCQKKNNPTNNEKETL